MNDYFKDVRAGLGDAVKQQRHLRWYRRIGWSRRTYGLAAVFATLVIAAPAVGAVTNWFGIGSPTPIPKQSPTQNAGRAYPHTSRLIPTRVPDPQGGPPWGVRIVQTTRGAACLQVGRIEHGKVGTLGIDGVWHNDRLFHPYPKAAEGNGFECGNEDGAGHAFMNSEYMGLSSSGLAWKQTPNKRMMYVGLLGPDATSITYETPTGQDAIEKTGPDGAYLLVFARNQRTCAMYANSRRLMARSPQCSGISGGETVGAPVLTVHYRGGTVCRPYLTPAIRSHADAIARTEMTKFGIHGRASMESPKGALYKRATDRLLARYAASMHLASKGNFTMRTLAQEEFGQCPSIGYVAPNQTHLTAAMVKTPLHVKIEPRTKSGIPIKVSFKARQPVKNSSSYFEQSLNGPCGDEDGQIDSGNVHIGQTLHDNQTISGQTGGVCKGVFHGIISYMQNSGPAGGVGEGASPMPGSDGSVIVGRFTITIR